MKKVAFIQHIKLILIIGIALSFLSCGSEDNTYAGGGIGGTGVISTGTVTEIGSVWVNGIEYDTGNADIYINDLLAGTGDQTVIDNLNPGHVVVVNGKTHSDDTGQADRVLYSSTLIGPIDEIEAPDDYNRIFHILEQVVVITGETVVMGELDDFGRGNLVEVSGFIDDSGNIQAFFISKMSETTLPGDRLRVTGIISDLDEDDKTFNLNTLRMSYASAELTGPLIHSMEEGLWVHVSGYLALGNPEFIADNVRPYNRLEEYDNLEIEIEGIVGSDLFNGRFSLEGYLIDIKDTTKFVGGNLEEILSGTRVEVEGAFSGDILIAKRIKFKTSFKVESELASKDGINQTLLLSGLGDLSISVNMATKYNGINKAFDALSIGDHLTIRGWIAPDDVLLANMVTSTAVGNKKVSIKGLISEINTPYLSISAIEINVDELPLDGFFNGDETPISREAFLSIVQAGDPVESKGTLLDDTVAWTALTLQEP